MVSVCMITYNHELFIHEAIEGILMQKCDFPFELVIGEDCSTDKTRQICQEYVTMHPEIKLLPSESNLGSTSNFFRTLQACTYKYIALCEGDDYWTDPLKLQKQVDFLEANKEYSLCFHNANVLLENGEMLRRNEWQEHRILSIIDFAQTNHIATASCVFRNNLGPLPEWLLQMKAADWGLHMINASRGKVYYFPECMSAYRKHPGGIWSGLNQEEKHMFAVEVMNQLDAAFNYKYHAYFQKAIENRMANLVNTAWPEDKLMPGSKKKVPFRLRLKNLFRKN